MCILQCWHLWCMLCVCMYWACWTVVVYSNVMVRISCWCNHPHHLLQLTKAKELLHVLSSTVTEEGPTDSKTGSPSHPHSQTLQRKQMQHSADAATVGALLQDGTSYSESSESTVPSDTESEVASAQGTAATVQHSKQRPTSLVSNSNCSWFAFQLTLCAFCLSKVLLHCPVLWA